MEKAHVIIAEDADPPALGGTCRSFIIEIGGCLLLVHLLTTKVGTRRAHSRVEMRERTEVELKDQEERATGLNAE